MGIDIKKEIKVNLMLRLKKEIHNNIKDIALKENISLNNLINQLLQYAIDEYHKTTSNKKPQ